jgi:hypothetical protein
MNFNSILKKYSFFLSERFRKNLTRLIVYIIEFFSCFCSLHVKNINDTLIIDCSAFFFLIKEIDQNIQ